MNLLLQVLLFIYLFIYMYLSFFFIFITIHLLVSFDVIICIGYTLFANTLNLLVNIFCNYNN